MSGRWLLFCLATPCIAFIALADRTPETNVGALKGSSGSTGATGSAGVTGATGATGATGSMIAEQTIPPAAPPAAGNMEFGADTLGAVCVGPCAAAYSNVSGSSALEFPFGLTFLASTSELQSYDGFGAEYVNESDGMQHLLICENPPCGSSISDWVEGGQLIIASNTDASAQFVLSNCPDAGICNWQGNGVNLSGAVCGVTPAGVVTLCADAGTTSAGTAGFLAEFTGPNSIGVSPVFDNAGNLGLGTQSPIASLDVQTDAGVAINATSNSTAWTIEGQNTGTGGVGVKGEAEGLAGVGVSGVDATSDGGIGAEAFSVVGVALYIDFQTGDPTAPVFWREESQAAITRPPVAGNCYHDSTTHLINCWNGSAWISGVQGSTGAVGSTGSTGAVGTANVSGPGSCVLVAGVTPSCTFTLASSCTQVWCTTSSGNLLTALGSTGTCSITAGTVTVSSTLTLASNTTVAAFCFPGF